MCVGQFEILSQAWDPLLGGTSFDNVLVKRFATELNDQVKTKMGKAAPDDVTALPRVMAGVRAAARKTKAGSSRLVFTAHLLDRKC